MTYRSTLITIIFFGLSLCITAQTVQLGIAAHGTGRTTGHIAELSVTNPGDLPVTIAPGTYYIPSVNRYQSYVGRIPRGHTVPGGSTIVVPINGYCTDVHTNPVPAGEPMSDFQDWVMVVTPTGLAGGPAYAGEAEGRDILENGAGKFETVPTEPESMASPDGVVASETPLVPGRVVPSFSPTAIPDIVGAAAYQAYEEQPENSIIVTFPQTDIPFGGTFSPRKDPVQFAPLVVAMVQAIEDAARWIQMNPETSTPFSAAPRREHEALVQQTIWIVTAALSGDAYTIEDFAENTHRQFTQSTGRSVASLPTAARDQLDSGIDDFWGAFTAVGVEAKVFRGVESAGETGVQEGIPGDGIEFQDGGRRVPPPEKCDCDRIEFNVVILSDDDGDGAFTEEDTEVGVEADNETHANTVQLEVASLGRNKQYKIRLTDIEVFCTCEDAAGDDDRCKVYPPINASDKDDDDFTNSDRTRAGDEHNQVGIHIANDGGDDSITENANATQSDAGWTDAGRTTYEFTLTAADKRKIPEISQRFEIIGRCESDDCGGANNVTICDKVVRIRVTEQ